MNAEFFKSKHLQFEYELKSGTSTSYYQTGGARGILPSRIGITRNTFAIVRQTGRGHLEKLTGQLKSTFKKEETSTYKRCKPFWIHSSLYEIPDFPVFLGYGDIGFTSTNGKTEGTGDLLIIHSSDQFQTVTIHIFPGLLFQKDLIISYVYSLLK